MIELPFSYLKEIASQIIFISAFLGGFSATVLGTLILSNNSGKILKTMIMGTSISAVSFIVAVFAMTQLVMLTLPGYPSEVNTGDTIFPRTVGFIAFFVGIISLIFVISVSGWVQSKRMGIATTILGVFGMVLILMSMSTIG